MMCLHCYRQILVKSALIFPSWYWCRGFRWMDVGLAVYPATLKIIQRPIKILLGKGFRRNLKVDADVGKMIDSHRWVTYYIYECMQPLGRGCHLGDSQASFLFNPPPFCASKVARSV
jgi:hypothetical protein